MKQGPFLKDEIPFLFGNPLDSDVPLWSVSSETLPRFQGSTYFKLVELRTIRGKRKFHFVGDKVPEW